MESPEAAWVDMVMGRLHALECERDSLRARVAEAAQEASRSAVARFPDGFEWAVDTHYAFSVCLGARETLDSVTRRLAGCQGSMTVALVRGPGCTYVEGVACDTELASAAEMAQTLDASLGPVVRLEHDIPSSRVLPARSTLVWEQVVLEAPLSLTRRDGTWHHSPVPMRPHRMGLLRFAMTEPHWLLRDPSSSAAVARIVASCE